MGTTLWHGRDSTDNYKGELGYYQGITIVVSADTLPSARVDPKDKRPYYRKFEKKNRGRR